jgi:hypothetical protein
MKMRALKISVISVGCLMLFLGTTSQAEDGFLGRVKAKFASVKKKSKPTAEEASQAELYSEIASEKMTCKFNAIEQLTVFAQADSTDKIKILDNAQEELKGYITSLYAPLSRENKDDFSELERLPVKISQAKSFVLKESIKIPQETLSEDEDEDFKQLERELDEENWDEIVKLKEENAKLEAQIQELSKRKCK